MPLRTDESGTNCSTCKFMVNGYSGNRRAFLCGKKHLPGGQRELIRRFNFAVKGHTKIKPPEWCPLQQSSEAVQGREGGGS